jgi:hypothetical protein
VQTPTINPCHALSLSSLSIEVDPVKNHAVIYYTLNNSLSIASPRSAASAELIKSLRPLARHGGVIPNHSPFRVTVLHSQDCTVFTVRRGSEPITSGMLAWTLDGEAEAWTTIERLYLTAVFNLPTLASPGAVLKKPSSVPWLAVVRLAGVANQPREIFSWLGEFDRCMAWAILSERLNR